MIKYEPLNYSLSTVPLQPVVVTESTHRYTYVLHPSFKRHMTNELLERMKAICDEGLPTWNNILIYVSTSYRKFCKKNTRVIVTNFNDRSRETIIRKVANDALNNKYNYRLSDKLSQGEFHDSDQINKINRLLDKGASEKALLDSTALNKGIDEFIFADSLLTHLNGSSYTSSKKYLFTPDHSETFANNISLYAKISEDQVLVRYLAYQFLTALNNEELQSKINICSQLIDINYLKRELRSVLDITTHKPLAERLDKAETLVDLVEFSTDMKAYRFSMPFLSLKEKPFYPLKYLAESIQFAVVAVSATLKENSPLTDTVILDGSHVVYANSVLLAFQSDYFGNSQRFLATRDENNKRVYDLTEECRDPNLAKVLKYFTEGTLHEAKDLATKFSLNKAAEYFGSTCLRNFYKISFDHSHAINELLGSFSSWTSENLKKYVRESENKEEVIQAALDIAYPGLKSLLTYLQADTSLRGIILFYGSLLDHEKSFSPEGLLELSQRLLVGEINVDMVSLIYFIHRALALETNDFAFFLPSLLAILTKHLNIKPVVKNFFLNESGYKPSDEQNVEIKYKIDFSTLSQRFPRNYLQLFGGSFLREQYLIQNSVIDLTPYHGKFVSTILNELQHVYFEIKNKSLQETFESDVIYHALGLDYPHHISPRDREIFSLLYHSEFEKLNAELKESTETNGKYRQFVIDYLVENINNNPFKVLQYKDLLRTIHKNWKSGLPVLSGYYRFSRINFSHYPPLQKLLSEGFACSLTKEEVDQFLVPEALIILMAVIVKDPSHSLSRLIASRITLKIKKILHHDNSITKKLGKKFLATFNLYKDRFPVLNFSELDSEDQKTFSFLTQNNPPIKWIELPNNQSSMDSDSWLRALLPTLRESANHYHKECSIVIDTLPSLVLSENHTFYLRNTLDFITAQHHNYRSLVYLGGGKTLKYSSSIKGKSLTLQKGQITLDSFKIEQLNLVPSHFKTVLKQCEVDEIRFIGKECYELEIIDCTGPLNVTIQSEFTHITIKRTEIDEHQLLYFAEKCHNCIFLDRHIPVSDEIWQKIKDKIVFKIPTITPKLQNDSSSSLSNDYLYRATG